MNVIEPGQRFGKLVVVRKVESDRLWKAFWLCRCDCGREKAIRVDHLKRGAVQSCGCFRDQRLKSGLRLKHGDSRRDEHTSEYRTWIKMLNRCYDANDKAYHRYGGRGITVCDRWRNSYEAFLADMGRRPSDSHSIDRTDNDGNYEPATDRHERRRFGWLLCVQDLTRPTCAEPKSFATPERFSFQKVERVRLVIAFPRVNRKGAQQVPLCLRSRPRQDYRPRAQNHLVIHNSPSTDCQPFHIWLTPSSTSYPGHT